MSSHPSPRPDTSAVNARLVSRAEESIRELKRIVSATEIRVSQMRAAARCEHDWESFWDSSFDGHRTDRAQHWRCRKCQYSTLGDLANVNPAGP